RAISTASSSVFTTLATRTTLLASQFDPHAVIVQVIYVDDFVPLILKQHPKVGRVQLVEERDIAQNERNGVLFVDGLSREVLLAPQAFTIIPQLPPVRPLRNRIPPLVHALSQLLNDDLATTDPAQISHFVLLSLSPQPLQEPSPPS